MPMKRLFLTAVATVGLFATAARADVRTIYHAGAWDAVAGTVDDGTWMCGARITGADRVFIVKWFEKTHNVAIHVGKRSWVIPPGTKVNMTLRFDQNDVWSGSAEAFAGSMLELGINNPAKFLLELGQANTLEIAFPDGSEGAWVARMVGSQAAIARMQACVRDRVQPAEAPTQPFGRGTPTQPFNQPNPFPFSRQAPVERGT
jgi:hypothetical protein